MKTKKQILGTGRVVAGMASPKMVTLYGFSYGERRPRWATNFRDEREAAEWLRRAANGTGALEPSAVDILKAAPDCLIWYSRRDGSYNCDYISDNEGRPIHGTIEDYRALLLYYRKRHILEHIANDIRKAVEMGCTFVVSTADRRARVEVEREPENGLYITTWKVGEQTDETRAHLHAIDAAAVVWTFREGYACDLGDIVTEAEGIKVGDKVRHNKHEEVATVTAIREAFVNFCDGYRYLYTLDFGQSVKGPFDVELNGGEFLREALIISTTKDILS